MQESDLPGLIQQVLWASFALAVVAIRFTILSRMDRARANLTVRDPVAVKQFRRVHITGMALNASLLACVAWTMTRLGL